MVEVIGRYPLFLFVCHSYLNSDERELTTILISDNYFYYINLYRAYNIRFQGHCTSNIQLVQFTSLVFQKCHNRLQNWVIAVDESLKPT